MDLELRLMSSGSKFCVSPLHAKEGGTLTFSMLNLFYSLEQDCHTLERSYKEPDIQPG